MCVAARLQSVPRLVIAIHPPVQGKKGRERKQKTPMAIFSRPGVIGMWRNVAMHPKNLSFLIFRVLHSLLKKFRKSQQVEPTKVEAMLGKSVELPQDILIDIFALLEIPDLVRAGSVCSSWRSAYTFLRDYGSYKQTQTPCLFYTCDSAGEKVSGLYSLAEKRAYKLTLPEPPMHTRHIIGSSLGWLVTADERSELHIVNPVTSEQIALPSVATIEHVKPIFDDAGVICKYEFPHDFYGPSIYTLDNLRNDLYYKAFVFSDQSTGSYIVVLIHHPTFQLSFARTTDCKWTWLPPNLDYRDCMYKDGLLYAIEDAGGIDVFNLADPTITRKVVMDDTGTDILYRRYMVQAPWGDVLQVLRGRNRVQLAGVVALQRYDQLESKTKNIVLYKVDLVAKELVEMNGLCDHVLFLGHSQSLCLSVEEYPWLKANHAYLTDDDGLISLIRNNQRDLCVINLENNRKEEIVSQLWCSWPAPIWITPSLTKMSSRLDR